MNLFDKLVTEALKNQAHLSPLRAVVEKELLHHDILRVMRDYNFFTNLTFIGGTCLRLCYGGVRLSEDLDFTGGTNFSRKQLSEMGKVITKNLQNKYGLRIVVSEPVKDKQNADTWKIKIETRPKAKDISNQRINIDICTLPSYERLPMMLLNPYGVDMGTSGLIIQAQSREEIYADKLVAFALRPNRLKYRDIWDILWLHNKGLEPRLALIPRKLEDRNCIKEYFFKLFSERLRLLKEAPKVRLEFKQEMLRFLPPEQIRSTLEQHDLWSFIVYLIGDLDKQIRKSITP
jgi:predicted nucleotidyltransferase component of viral defense system